MKVIDISAHNGRPDFPRVKAAGIAGVYLKLTEGGQGPGEYVDPLVMSNAKAATEAGLLIGYYHFATLANARPDNPIVDAGSEAALFARKMVSAPADQMIPMLDVEDQVRQGLTIPIKCAVDAWINSFANHMSLRGYKIGLYSNRPFLDSHLPAGHALGRLPLWHAQYTTAPTPRLPKGFGPCVLWQFTDKEKVDGVEGPVDVSVCEQLPEARFTS